MSKATKELVVPNQFQIMQGSISDITEMIKENLGDEQINMTDLTKVTFPSGKSTTWNVPDIEAESGEIETKEIVGIVVSTQTTRQFWKKVYDGKKDPPQCASQDGATGIGDPGGSCAKCPNNEFDSHPEGKKKWCQEKRLMFTVTESDILPMVIGAPAASLKNVRTYLLGLTSKRKFSHGVYTALTLETDKNEEGIHYPKLTLRKVGDVENTEVSAAYAKAIKPFLQRQAAAMTKKGE